MVKRGIDESILDEGESEVIDHLLFMVHGIGSGCDLKFRSVEEVGKKKSYDYFLKTDTFLLFQLMISEMLHYN